LLEEIARKQHQQPFQSMPDEANSRYPEKGNKVLGKEMRIATRRREHPWEISLSKNVGQPRTSSECLGAEMTKLREATQCVEDI